MCAVGSWGSRPAGVFSRVRGCVGGAGSLSPMLVGLCVWWCGVWLYVGNYTVDASICQHRGPGDTVVLLGVVVLAILIFFHWSHAL